MQEDTLVGLEGLWRPSPGIEGWGVADATDAFPVSTAVMSSREAAAEEIVRALLAAGADPVLGDVVPTLMAAWSGVRSVLDALAEVHAVAYWEVCRGGSPQRHVRCPLRAARLKTATTAACTPGSGNVQRLRMPTPVSSFRTRLKT